jgi:oxalate decarboxylase/phosphoglucose isomerase-like protein (cupin superfamily)
VKARIYLGSWILDHAENFEEHFVKTTRLENCESTPVAMEGEVPREIREGDFILVKPNELYQYRNTGDETLVFICAVPSRYE